jgi:DNA-3-methyladenine glycosylase
MFGDPGHAYVYFTMGVHYCLNVTTEGHGTPGAVLIRAIEPMEGLELMQRNRGMDDVRRLAAGPGNLTKALDIGRGSNGEDLTRSQRLFIESGQWVGEVGVSTRVGVSSGRSFRWRFFAKDNTFVSRGKPSG